MVQVLDRLRQLTHPNIVEFIDKLEDTEGIIMVLEYCPGTSQVNIIVKTVGSCP